ncbi:hypothetical protein [Echinicola shivajiensis]|uniref:hypothetical protein n=1 Tax=Echinicola shivajiensis TaxID=1035916 RepID=UPI001BFC0C3F|nr:hypothetical protein [Echinicola shivajiensis]
MKQYLIFSLCIIILTISSCNHKQNPLDLPQNLEIIPSIDNSTDIYFNYEYQVVVYLNTDKLNLHALSEVFEWAETKEKYSEIAFIFYLSGQDKEKIERELNNYHFPFPVLYDPSGSFFQQNKLDTVSLDNKNLLPFLVKKHQVQGLAQIGVTKHFQQQLEYLLNENK